MLFRDAWNNAEWTTNVEDIRGGKPTHDRFEKEGNFSVAVRWDDEFVYVGAKLYGSTNPTITGNNENLNTDQWWGVKHQQAPYFDNDFEVFIDPFRTGWFYKEFEMNANNATVDVLWRAPSEYFYASFCSTFNDL